MVLFEFAIILTAFFTSLVAGLVFTFAIVVMPGIGKLGDFSYLQSFKAMDRVIQDGQPVFITVWLGSAVAMIVSTVLGVWRLDGLDLVILVMACVMYLAGVHFPTITINIPLNNQLQSLELGNMTEDELLDARQGFEKRWLRWNYIRTIVALLTTVLLLVLLTRL